MSKIDWQAYGEGYETGERECAAGEPLCKWAHERSVPEEKQKSWQAGYTEYLHTWAWLQGYRVAAREIAAGTASHQAAKERDILSGDQGSRISWDAGYEAACCAYRLGYEPSEMVRAGIEGESTQTTASVVGHLIDGRWPHTRPDPRKDWEPV